MSWEFAKLNKAIDAAKDIEKATDGFFEWVGGL
jgi:hypothetical protein